MSKLHQDNNGKTSKFAGTRRLHRWFGISAAVFVLVLSVTGIALNHSDDWNLDRRYVAWGWLLDAYGISVPEAATSFESGGRRVTLVGNQLYFDDRDLAAGEDTLAGFAMHGDTGVIGLHRVVLLVSADGELIERLDTTSILPDGIQRVGQVDGRVAIGGAAGDFVADESLTGFRTLGPGARVRWSATSPVPAGLRAALDTHYRGRGLTVERLLTDLHSGRIARSVGVRVMDAVGVFLIVLCITGILLWARRPRDSKKN